MKNSCLWCYISKHFILGLLLLLLFKRLPLKEYKRSTSSKFTGQKKKLIPQSLSLRLNLIFLQQQGCLIRLLACIVCLLLISDEQRLLLVFRASAMGSTWARLRDECLGHQVKCRWTGLLPADFCNFNTNGLAFEVLPCCCRGLKASAPTVIVVWQFTLSSSKKKKLPKKAYIAQSVQRLAQL